MTVKNDIESLKSYLVNIFSLTRGTLPPSYISSAVLLFVIIRRMECLFEPYRKKVLSIYNRDKDQLDEVDMERKLYDAMKGELNYFILSPGTMQELLMQGYFQSAAGFEHYIRCFDRNTTDQLLKYGALDYANRLFYAKSFAQVLSRICILSLDSSMSREEFEDIVSWLLQIASADGRAASVSYSTSELSKVMAALLFAEGKVNKNAILYDPVCGSGNLLRVAQSQVRQPISVFGQEIMERMVSFNNLLAKASAISKYYFVSGDVLEEDKFSDNQFDYVIADLPLRQRIERRPFLAESRFPIGTPTNGDATGLFVQHIISKMSTKGRAIFTCVPSFFIEETSSSSRLRSWMLKNDIIESIVSLPAGFIPGTGVKTCLCILNKDKSNQRKGKIQIINADSLFPRQKNRGIVLTNESLNMLVSMYRSFENNDYCHIARWDELCQEEANMNQPTRSREKYRIDIEAPFKKVEEIRSVDAIRKDVAKLNEEIASLFANLFAESKNNQPVYDPSDFRPMQALLGSVVQIAKSRTPLVRIGTKSKYPVLSPDYLRGYVSEPSEYVESVSNDQVVKDGDILIMMDGDNAGEVFRGKQGCLSRTMAKLEVNTSVFYQEYLYYLLKAKEPELKLRTRGDFIKHLSMSDLRSLQIVMPSITLQITTARALNPKIEAIDKLLPLLGGDARATLVEYRQALIQDAIATITPVMK